MSHQKLSAGLVCVLHPLSYLIKRARFRRPKRFTSQYRLLGDQVISSVRGWRLSRGLAKPEAESKAPTHPDRTAPV